MEFLLNERSLYGQFHSAQDFLESLKPVIRCIKIIHDCSDLGIYKITNFHDCKITKDQNLGNLKLGGVSDELLRFKLSLDREVYKEPYWDRMPEHDLSQDFMWEDENVSATSLAEAAVTGNSLLSFQSDRFNDRMLTLNNDKMTYLVDSIHTPKYLLEQYYDSIHPDRKRILLIRYEGTRIDFSTLEDEYGVLILERNEFAELLSTLDKFVQHESWESIGRDDGLEYKKYSPSSVKENWFRGARYQGKTIMKFRFSRVLRCYGYRKGDKFRVLRFERDHKISNYG